MEITLKPFDGGDEVKVEGIKDEGFVLTVNGIRVLEGDEIDLKVLRTLYVLIIFLSGFQLLL